MKKLSDYVAAYKEQQEIGDIQIAYKELASYVMSLKAYLSKELSGKFLFGNISPGYMDYTYFPFFNDVLRNKGLRFGVVLNHKKCNFELWLMGRNANFQNKYWKVFKTSKWNKDRSVMPQYAVLEAVLVDCPDFDQLDDLTRIIKKEIVTLSKEIIKYLSEKE